MIIYFEDGCIMNDDLYFNEKEAIKVDAGLGHSHCYNRLISIDKNFPFDTNVYTNALEAFSNAWCWDEERQMPMLYIRDVKGNWTLISELTTRELRPGHNLAKMYVNGEFNIYIQEED